MYSIVLIFFLFLSVSTQAQVCLDNNELTKILSDFENDTKPLFQGFQKPIVFSYSDYNISIGGYSDFNNSTSVLIKIVGSKCENRMYTDEIKLLLCHELGHVMGGSPFMFFQGASPELKVSAEGQADYFASNTCLPYLFKNQIEPDWIDELMDDPEIIKVCPQSNKKEQSLCIRIAIASRNFSIFMYEQLKRQDDFIPPKSPGLYPEFFKEDSKVVTQTLTRDYPSPLCRLQTLIAGFYNEDRPRCWFNPEE
jgi:hypothetical protein